MHIGGLLFRCADACPVFRISRLSVYSVAEDRISGKLESRRSLNVTEVNNSNIASRHIRVKKYSSGYLVIDAASGTFRGTLTLSNPEGKLTSGLRCQVSFLAKSSSPAVQQSRYCTE